MVFLLERERMNSKDKGDITELAVIAQLAKMGYTILKPLSDNKRYDYIIEKDGEFKSVQCKTARFENGAVVFKTCSSNYHRGGKTSSYRGQVDYFGVYCPYNDECYLIAVDDVGERECKLRVTPTKNMQIKRVRYADSFKI